MKKNSFLEDLWNTKEEERDKVDEETDRQMN